MPEIIEVDDDDETEVFRRPVAPRRRRSPRHHHRPRDDDDESDEEVQFLAETKGVVVIDDEVKQPRKKKKRPREEPIVILEDDDDDDKRKRMHPAMRRGARGAACLNDVDQRFANVGSRERSIILSYLFRGSKKAIEVLAKKKRTLWSCVLEGASSLETRLFSSEKEEAENFGAAQKALPLEFEDCENGNVLCKSVLEYCRRRAVATRDSINFDAAVDAIEPLSADDKGEVSYFDCCLCMDSFRLKDVVFCGGEEAHGLCRPCFREFCRQFCADKGVGSAGAECPVPKCQSKFSRRDVLLSVSTLDVMIMDERELDRSMRTALGDAHQLRCVCGAVGILQKRDLKGDNVLPCPECHRHYCAKCGQAAHGDEPCGGGAGDKKSKKDDKKTQAWLRNKTKQCPNCHESVEKSEGCNHVHCRCGANWCYLCTGPFPNCHCGHFEQESKKEVARLQRQQLQDQDAAMARAIAHLHSTQDHFSNAGGLPFSFAGGSGPPVIGGPPPQRRTRGSNGTRRRQQEHRPRAHRARRSQGHRLGGNE